MNANTKKTILEFLQSNSMAVIATNGHNTPFPESALIAFDQYENFEIVFETFAVARKYENLMYDKHVSLVVGSDARYHITFQYEGIAQAISEDETEAYIQHFLRKDTPCTEKFLRDKRVRLFKIKPIWLRYSDYTGDKPNIIEHTFK